MMSNIIDFCAVKERKYQMENISIKNRITDYKVGDRFFYHKKPDMKWAISEIKDKEVKIIPLHFMEACDGFKTYNIYYFKRLLSENKIEIINKPGKIIRVNEKQKEAILKMGFLKEGGVEIVELLLSLGIEKCVLEKDFCHALITKNDFKQFWGIVKKHEIT